MALTALITAVTYRGESTRWHNAAVELAHAHNPVSGVEDSTRFHQPLLRLRRRYVQDHRRGRSYINFERRPNRVRIPGGTLLRNLEPSDYVDFGGTGEPDPWGGGPGGPVGTGGGPGVSGSGGGASVA